jgi:hypothetical protein|tara:strand:- start:1345 stop:2172 length:828 start_codon:yes stop_codon:yes gene_type:complete
MAKNDLKGIDLSKVGNNKNVDYTFRDYMEDMGLTESGAIRDLEGAGIFLNELEPITPEVKPSVRGKVAQFLFGSPGSGQELLGGKLVSTDRPKDLGRLTAGLADALTLNLTDFDQRGGGFLGLKDVNPLSGLGGKPEDFKLPKSVKEAVDAMNKSKEDEGSKNPVDNIDKIVDAELRYKKGADTQSRKGRILDNALDFLNMQLQTPFLMKTLKDASTFKQQQLLDAEAIKQGLPNAVQSRMLAADTGAAQLRQSLAAQQDAATRFAGLGMQRRFG